MSKDLGTLGHVDDDNYMHTCNLLCEQYLMSHRALKFRCVQYLPLKDELMVKSTKLIPTKHNIHVDATSYEGTAWSLPKTYSKSRYYCSAYICGDFFRVQDKVLSLSSALKFGVFGSNLYHLSLICSNETSLVFALGLSEIKFSGFGPFHHSHSAIPSIKCASGCSFVSRRLCSKFIFCLKVEALSIL